MKPDLGLPAALSDLGHRWLQSVQQWWRIVHLGAVVLALAVSPSSYTHGRWPALARHLYGATAPVLLWFTALSSLLELVLIRIVVVTAVSYGLSQYAVDMVVRVLVLELIPLGAALFVALRITLPQGAELLALTPPVATGQTPTRAVLVEQVLPRALAGMFAVLMLAVISCLAALVLAYLNLYGFTPWAWHSYTRLVGHVFNPGVTLIFAFKTLFFALTVALVPLASSLVVPVSGAGRSGHELLALVRMFLALLLIEVVSLLGNYY